jgi:transposase
MTIFSNITINIPKKIWRIVMTQQKYTKSVSIVHPVCCGLDVHKRIILACLISQDQDEPVIEIKEFSTFTNDIIKLKDWLLEHECPVVAMESTGIYWRPVHNILEDSTQVVLVNARHYKNVPGRKTDVSDSQWLAELLRHGLLKGSFIPDKEIRQWRELVTMRNHFVATESDYRRRIQKVFETANVKIDSVVSDLFGVSGRNLIDLILTVPTEELTRENVQECLRGRLTTKGEELFLAIQGFVTDHHRFLLTKYLDVVDSSRQSVMDIESRIREVMKPQQPLLDRLQEIPGIGEIAAAGIIARLGVNMDTFPTSAALCSWAGVCPGNNESAGKRHSGHSPVRKHPLKTLLVEVAWAAIKKKDSYFREKYYRLKARRGAKRAIIAIAHKILKVIYVIIKEGKHYQELGAEFLNENNKKAQIYRLKKMAEKYGFALVEKAA